MGNLEFLVTQGARFALVRSALAERDAALAERDTALAERDRMADHPA
jgi:hypothetical protein